MVWQNEKEGFQVFFREQEKVRNLRIEVSPFLNTQNEVLQHTVYYEEFFYLTPQPQLNPPDSLAEALVPYSSNQVKQTSVGHNVVFYVELQSLKNQTPGNYVSTITAYDGNEVIDTRTVIAKVWNFELPESHYSEVVMGLYNRNSGYPSTSSLFTLNGINVDSAGNVAESDLDEAKRVLNGYQNCLLEHGVSTYEIPRWLMGDDPKAAELTMADPRRKVFTVPVLYGDLNNSDSDFKPEAQQVLNQYKDIVYDNPFLKDKAFFYPYDEPENATDFACIDQFCNVISDYWPGYHATVPFYSNYDTTIMHFDGKIDILCPHKDSFDPFDPENPNIDFTQYENWLQDYMTRDHTWRYYPGGKQNGGIECFIDAIATVGTMRRVVFWQQYIVNSDGILIWNCAYLPNWVKKTLPASSGIQKGNGDGVLLYPGTMFGQDAATPVVSLRLKQLAEGIDDYDYLCLAKEFIGPNYVTNILQSGVTPSEALAVFYHYTQLDYLCKIFNRHYDYDAWSSRFMNITRHYIGNALSAANTEHDWSEWQTAVLPDETHSGLEIRTCKDCNAQESRPKTFLYRFLGTEDNQWTNLANWEGNPQILPTLGEAVFIASNCEINADQTVSSITVKNGYNLTVKSGATLTSRLITTEENAQVIIEDGAQLYTVSENVQATVKKFISEQSSNGGWHFISSPIATDVMPSVDNGIISLIPEDYDLYYYDEPTHYWMNYKPDGQNADFYIEPMKGFLYANTSDDTLSFVGMLQPGTDATTDNLSYQAQTLKGWNLVGNPYPCNAYVNRNYYVMNEDGSAIEPVAVSMETAIPVCTGVMVKADTVGETVTFSKTTPEAAVNQGVLQIVLSQGSGILLDKVMVSFNTGDRLEKFVFKEGNATLSIPQGGKELAIACAEKVGELPLNFKAAKNGEYTITVNPEAVEMDYLHLIDNMTGNDIDLLASPSYSFNAETTDYASRFRLVFSASGDADGDNEDFAFVSNNDIIINGEGTVQVIDMTGRIIVSVDEGTRCIPTAGMTSGVYVLRLINGNDVKTQKIVVR